MLSGDTEQREQLLADLVLSITELIRSIESGAVSLEKLCKAVEEAMRLGIKGEIQIDERPGIPLTMEDCPIIVVALDDLSTSISSAYLKGAMSEHISFDDPLVLCRQIGRGITSGKLDATFFRNLRDCN